MDKNINANASVISEQRIWAQVERIFSSAIFPNTERLTTILKYLIKEELKQSGKSTITSEVIAAEAFTGRVSADNVRNGVKLLREKLEAYYEAALQKTDENEVDVIIEIISQVKFGYRVIFKEGHVKEAAETFERVAITPNWSYGRVYALLEEASVGVPIRILTTWFIEGSPLIDKLKELAEEKRAQVQVVMMNPEHDQIVKARFLLHKGVEPAAVQADIMNQLSDFQSCGAELEKKRTPENTVGSLQACYTDTMPFAFFFQIGDVVLIGFFLPLTPYFKGPMLEANVHSKLGQTMLKNWEACWQISPQIKPSDG